MKRTITYFTCDQCNPQGFNGGQGVFNSDRFSDVKDIAGWKKINDKHICEFCLEKMENGKCQSLNTP